MATDSQMDYTLLDNKWKDSFDKLLDPRSALRASNLVRKEVNVSFNMDSSVENVEYSIQGNPARKALLARLQIRDKRISTPMKDYLNPLPFKCSLSPIRTWVFDHFSQGEIKQPIELSHNSHSLELLGYNDPSETPLTQSQGNNAKPIQHFSIKEATKCVLTKKPLTIDLKTPSRPSKAKNVNIADIPIIIEPTMKSYQQTYDEHNDSEQIKKLVIRRISKCRKSVSALKASTGIVKNYRNLVFERCSQQEPVSFNTLFNWERILKCKKIGEGAYGEVFMYSNRRSGNGNDIVLKVIPIEGSLTINGETQKTFEQILPEIVTTLELSNLRYAKTNFTKRFVNIKKATCVRGEYPKHLINLWTEYDNDIGSENDNPEVFPNDQLYIVLELDFGGRDMETYIFNNAQQAFLALQQIILALAVAEEAFEFEHRDLHLGNILISTTKTKTVRYVINDKTISVPSGGIHITIIDYTLSRMTYDNCCLYNDLSTDDELFEATGDYQYDVYRQMRRIVENDWRKFEPKTNIFWLVYVIKKMLKGIHYKNEQSKVHKLYLEKLQDLEKIALTFKSALDFANHLQNV